MRKSELGRIGILSLVVVLAVGVLGAGYAFFTETLDIEANVTTGEWDVGGSPGFWGAWDNHNTYTEVEILCFLNDINSKWLLSDNDESNSIGISDMLAILKNSPGENKTMKEKFLRQYLATRLNVEAGRLTPAHEHDFFDPGDYLGLSGHAELGQIISAIEDKYPTPPDYEEPTVDQFETMKDICEALNADKVTPLPLP